MWFIYHTFTLEVVFVFLLLPFFINTRKKKQSYASLSFFSEKYFACLSWNLSCSSFLDFFFCSIASIISNVFIYNIYHIYIIKSNKKVRLSDFFFFIAKMVLFFKQFFSIFVFFNNFLRLLFFRFKFFLFFFFGFEFWHFFVEFVCNI